MNSTEAKAMSGKHTDAAKTRSLVVLTILCKYCNKPLTQDLVERIHFEIVQEMEHGSTSWAFAIANGLSESKREAMTPPNDILTL